jgi:transposase
MIDATYLKTHRTETSLQVKKGAWTPDRPDQGRLNTNLYAVTDRHGRPNRFFIAAGQLSDYVGARALCGSLPAVDWLIADRSYDADWFRETLQDKGIRPCITGRKSRDKAVRYNKRRYKRRNRMEIILGRLKDGSQADTIAAPRSSCDYVR